MRSYFRKGKPGPIQCVGDLAGHPISFQIPDSAPGPGSQSKATCATSARVLVAHLCLTVCNPMDCSLPGSSVHRLLQAGILEWLAISFSGGPPDPGINPRSPALQADSLSAEPPGKPFIS